MDWSSVYGIGKGGAQIYKGNPALDDLQQTYALRQQQRAQDDAQFAQNVAKLNMKGARDADMPLLNKQYQDILDTHAKLRSTNNLSERQALQQQLQQKQQGWMYDASHSSEMNEREKAAMNLRFTHPDDLADNYNSDMTDLTKTPSIGDNAVKYNDAFNTKSQSWIQKPVDLGKVSDDIVKRITTTSKSSQPTQKDNMTGLYYTPTESTSAINKNDYTNQIAQAAKSQPAVGRALMKQYGTNDIADAVQKHVESTYPVYNKNMGTDVIHGSEFQSEGQRKERLPSWIESWNLNHGGNPNAGISNNQLTPAQYLIAGNPQTKAPGMLQGNTEAMNRFINLYPKGQYGNQQPSAKVDQLTGEHVFNFPAQVVPDQKAIAFNNQLKKDYKENPEKKDRILGMIGGKEIPFEQSEKAKDLLPESKVKKPAQEYRIPTNDPQAYVSKIAQMGKDQNINIPQYNQILGQKSGHGVIDPKVEDNKPKRNSIKQSEISIKAAAAGYSVKEYTDLLKQKGIKIE